MQMFLAKIIYRRFEYVGIYMPFAFPVAFTIG